MGDAQPYGVSKQWEITYLIFVQKKKLLILVKKISPALLSLQLGQPLQQIWNGRVREKFCYREMGRDWLVGRDWPAWKKALSVLILSQKSMKWTSNVTTSRFYNLIAKNLAVSAISPIYRPPKLPPQEQISPHFTVQKILESVFNLLKKPWSEDSLKLVNNSTVRWGEIVRVGEGGESWPFFNEE